MDTQSFLSTRRQFFLRYLILLIGVVLLSLQGLQAQNLPVFRIGVLDTDAGEIASGARLAVSEINADGGVTGADGTRFLLELVIQSPEDMETAVSNINQANVIAVLGPETSTMVLGNLSLLQTLNVPILTPAQDDTILIQDTSGLFVRIRAQEVLTGRALADYLLSEFPSQPISIVQLDLEGTAGVVGFSTAVNGSGASIQNEFLLEEGESLQDFVSRVVDADPAILVVYGAPDISRQFYVQMLATAWDGQFVYNQASHETFETAIPTAQLAGIVGVTTWSYAAPDARSRDFVASYTAFFEDVPRAIDAAAYDAVYMMQAAIGEAGDLLSNLKSLSRYEGVQGVLAPTQLSEGETSNQVMIYEKLESGGQVVLARYAGGQRLDEDLLVNPDLAVATPTPTATPTPDGVVVTITSAVQNVRSGPGLNYDVIGRLDRGDQAEVIGASVDLQWVVINYRGVNGWLSRDILELFGDERSIPILQAPPSPTPAPTATPLPATLTPTVTPPPAVADVVVVSASPARLTVGQPFTVNVTVSNQGGANAGAFAIASSFFPGNVYASYTFNNLNAGQQSTVNLTGNLPSGTTGPQSVVIVADLNNQVAEGPAGEANNSNYTYNYLADAPVLSSGNLSLADGATVSLDTGTPDIQWSGGSLIPQGTTTIAVINNFGSFSQVHRDGIAAVALTNSAITTVPVGTLIGIQTDGGGNYAVIEITGATVGGNLQFNFRSYQ